MNQVIKNGIIDGYFKTFDMLGEYDIGSKRHKELKQEDRNIYYQTLKATMVVVFVCFIFCMGLILFTHFYFSEYLNYSAIPLFLLFVPLWLSIFNSLLGYLKD